MKKIALLAVSLSAIFAASARAATITFDGIPDGTVINTFYSGVTFSNPAGGDVYAQTTVGALSGTNVISVLNGGLDGAFNASNGGVQAVFATGQSTVSIDAAPIAPIEGLGPLLNKPFLQAWDTTGAFITVFYYSLALPNIGQGTAQTLTINAAPGTLIGRVQFSTQTSQGGQIMRGLFDNLTYGTAGPGPDPGPDPVPEPASLALLGMGLAGVVAKRLRNRNQKAE